MRILDAGTPHEKANISWGLPYFEVDHADEAHTTSFGCSSCGSESEIFVTVCIEINQLGLFLANLLFPPRRKEGRRQEGKKSTFHTISFSLEISFHFFLLVQPFKN